VDTKSTKTKTKPEQISNCCLEEMVLVALSYGGKITKERAIGGQCRCGKKIVMKHGAWIAE